MIALLAAYGAGAMVQSIRAETYAEPIYQSPLAAGLEVPTYIREEAANRDRWERSSEVTSRGKFVKISEREKYGPVPTFGQPPPTGTSPGKRGAMFCSV